MRIIAQKGFMTKHIPEGKCSPRVRDNVNRARAHNAGYAGGKILRKRMARLAARKLAFAGIKSIGYRCPGAMK